MRGARVQWVRRWNWSRETRREVASCLTIESDPGLARVSGQYCQMENTHSTVYTSLYCLLYALFEYLAYSPHLNNTAKLLLNFCSGALIRPAGCISNHLGVLVVNCAQYHTHCLRERKQSENHLFSEPWTAVQLLFGLRVSSWL